MDWKEEVKKIVMGGYGDSNTEDSVLSYLNKHPELDLKEVWGYAFELSWNYVFELFVPEKCKGCKNVSKFAALYPCNACARNPKLQDFYEKL